MVRFNFLLKIVRKEGKTLNILSVENHFNNNLLFSLNLEKGK